jgi:nucleotide-binding universal stress UspA family protein
VRPDYGRGVAVRTQIEPGTAERRHVLGYRSVVVPVVDSELSQHALEAAARLAANRGAEVTVVTVLEVPLGLPLDALLAEEEADARELLRRAQAVVESFGIDTSTRLLRARDAAGAVVELAAERGADLIVIGSPRRQRRATATFGATVRGILHDAPCRVALLTAPDGR